MFKTYYQPTPTWARKLGDAILVSSLFIVHNSIVGHHDISALIALWMGGLGKFMTNFFAEKNTGLGTTNPDKPRKG